MEEELQDAVLMKLRASAVLSALVSKHIFDKVPLGFQMPWVVYGPVDHREADTECLEGFDVNVPIHVYAREKDKPQCLRICSAVRDMLRGVELELPSFGTHAMQFERMRGPMRDPDESSEHGIVEFSVIVERRA